MLRKIADTNQSLKEYLEGRRTATIGILKRLEDGVTFTLSVRPDVSAAGTYSIVAKGQGFSQSWRMQYKPSITVQEILDDFQEYLNIDNLGEFEVLAKDTPKRERTSPQAKEYPNTKVGEWMQQLDRYKSQKYLTQPQEKMIGILERRINADPSKWSVGDGVGWKVTRAQTNRGFQIIEIDAPNKMAVIRQVADTGLTSSGGNYDSIEDQYVPLGDLVRDNKYNASVKEAGNQETIKKADSPQFEGKPTEVVDEDVPQLDGEAPDLPPAGGDVGSPGESVEDFAEKDTSVDKEEAPKEPNFFNALTPFDASRMSDLEESRNQALAAGNLTKVKEYDNQIQHLMAKYEKPVRSPGIDYSHLGSQKHALFSEQNGELVDTALYVFNQTMKNIKSYRAARIAVLNVSRGKYVPIDACQGVVEFGVSFQRLGSRLPNFQDVKRLGVVRVDIRDEGNEGDVIPWIWDTLGRVYALNEEGFEKMFDLTGYTTGMDDDKPLSKEVPLNVLDLLMRK